MTDTQSQGREGLVAVKQVAQSVWTDFLDANPDNLTSPEDLPDHALVTFAQFFDMLREIDAAALTPLPDTEGWQMVPREPTEAMIAAFWDRHAQADTVFAEPADLYRAMLAAAPAPPSIDGIAPMKEEGE